MDCIVAKYIPRTVIVPYVKPLRKYYRCGLLISFEVKMETFGFSKTTAFRLYMNAIQAGIEKVNDFVRQEIEKSKPIPKQEKGTDSSIEGNYIRVGTKKFHF